MAFTGSLHEPGIAAIRSISMKERGTTQRLEYEFDTKRLAKRFSNFDVSDAAGATNIMNGIWIH